jgi:hypothetical protein
MLAAMALAAVSLIASLISEARTSKAPRNIPGTGECQHIIDLVGQVVATRGQYPAVTQRLLRRNLRFRIGKRKDDRVFGHFLDQTAGQDPWTRDANEVIGRFDRYIKTSAQE